jgi:RNA polymerase sigma-70 factor (ECF subfamily)
MASSHRRAKREQAGEVPEAPAVGNPESSAIEEQQRARLRAAVEELPMTDRQIVMLHFEGLSAAEIESVTGLTAGNVAVRLTRARQKLTTRMREEG